jgi:hypothetical protein
VSVPLTAWHADAGIPEAIIWLQSIMSIQVVPLVFCVVVVHQQRRNTTNKSSSKICYKLEVFNCEHKQRYVSQLTHNPKTQRTQHELRKTHIILCSLLTESQSPQKTVP